ncbi:hypothetical protein HHK36_010436 [Tetracentron sinense]|uniref:Uncharacterized protein n=1 Tax=Tetracentron sinense TaxID=13715 RepID=A0A835DML3_TETSI|nr:hypothetical protein HHK36_010436 [Tetracentron sinense]
MSKMKSPSDRKPPLSVSPNQLRPRRILRSSSSSIQSTPVSLTKTQVPNCSLGLEESPLRPEYRSISCELQALAKMVKEEFGNRDLGNNKFANAFSANSRTLFERGRFYDEYSAKRNERLKRKKSETGEDKRTVYSLGITVESGKRRDSKKLDSLRKSVPANFSIAQAENPRYLLRSSKENKKPPLPKNTVDGDRKIGTRRVLKI